VPDLQSGGCRFESQPGLLCTKVCLLSLPSLQGSVNEYQLRLGRQRQVWLIPIADERVGVQVKTVKSPENTCHTWALLRWWFTTKRRYIKCLHLHLYLLCAPIEHLPNQLNYLCSRIQNSFNCPCNKKLHRTTNWFVHATWLTQQAHSPYVLPRRIWSFYVNRCKHKQGNCKTRGARRSRSPAMEGVAPLKHASHNYCYHTEFGHSTSNGVGIFTTNPQNWGERWGTAPWDMVDLADPLKHAHPHVLPCWIWLFSSVSIAAASHLPRDSELISTHFVKIIMPLHSCAEGVSAVITLNFLYTLS